MLETVVAESVKLWAVRVERRPLLSESLEPLLGFQNEMTRYNEIRFVLHQHRNETCPSEKVRASLVLYLLHSTN